MKHFQKGFTLPELIAVFIMVACAGGWIANIIKLVSHINDPLTLMIVLRGIGIPAIPLGCVLGYL